MSNPSFKLQRSLFQARVWGSTSISGSKESLFSPFHHFYYLAGKSGHIYMYYVHACKLVMDH